MARLLDTAAHIPIMAKNINYIEITIMITKILIMKNTIIATFYMQNIVPKLNSIAVIKIALKKILSEYSRTACYNTYRCWQTRHGTRSTKASSTGTRHRYWRSHFT